MKTSQIIAVLTSFVLCIVMFSSCKRVEPVENDTETSPETTVAEETIFDDSDLTEEEMLANVSETRITIPPFMETRYFSLDFDRRMTNAYNDVVETISKYEKRSLIPITIPTSEYSKVLETVRCEQLAFFFLENRTLGDYNATAQTFEINFEYKYSIKEINTMLLKTRFAAQEILALTDDSMTDLEKVRIFHDYLTKNVQSSTDTEYVDSIYGALVEHRALCEGYAKAFSYLCNLSGIENMIVTGVTDIDHMWNMVKINGKWYHVDIGWDQPVAALREQYPDMLLYQYFLATDEIIENHCEINTSLGEPPHATDDDLSYYVREGLYAKTYDEALDIIERECRKCVDTGDEYFMLKTSSSNLYLTTISQLTECPFDGISDIDRIIRDAGYTGRISCSDYYKSYRIIIFLLD